MTELMRILYDYASKSRLSSSLEDCEQHQESAKVVDNSLHTLRKRLGAEDAQVLENYLGEELVVHELELEAMFCAGFSIGQELSRL